jgi:hypothetical protein
VRDDENVVAAVVPGNRKGRCAEIVLWRVGRAPVVIKTIVQCDEDGAGIDAVVDLALGGQIVLWQETNGGNNLELSISKATLTRPKEQRFGRRERRRRQATRRATDRPLSATVLLAYARGRSATPRAVTTRPCSQGRPILRAAAAPGRRAGAGLRPDAFFLIWTDGHAILIWHADKTLRSSTHGRVLWRQTAVPGLVGAAFQGSQLVADADGPVGVASAPHRADFEPSPLPGARARDLTADRRARLARHDAPDPALRRPRTDVPARGARPARAAGPVRRRDARCGSRAPRSALGEPGLR